MDLMNRKVRKLLRDPKLFFRDMVAKQINKPNVIQNALLRLSPARTREGHFKYAIISAVYNVEKYLDAYFRSIIRQSLDFENNINIVLVDDGSSDQSDRIIKKWVEKYPDNIIYLRKNNGGQASARNMGLEFVESNLIDVEIGRAHV